MSNKRRDQKSRSTRRQEGRALKKAKPPEVTLKSPTQTMAADWATVDISNGHVRFIFGQRRLASAPDTAELAAAMVVHMSNVDLLSWLNLPGTKKFHDNNMVKAQKLGVTPDVGAVNGFTPPSPERVAHASATFIFAGQANGATDMLFYYISPFLIHQKRSAQSPFGNEDIQPVVGIQMPFSYLIGLMGKLYSNNEEFVAQELLKEAKE